MKPPPYLVTFAALSGWASASLQYRSRPEFAVPRLNITRRGPATSLEQGYIFVAPYGFDTPVSHGPVQPGAYIFRDDGDLVWSGTGYVAGWVADFAPTVWNGKPYLRAFQGQAGSVDGRPTGRMYGQHVLLDETYRTAKVVTAGSHKWSSGHEFNVINEKTALIEVPVPVFTSLKPWGGGADQNWVLSSGFQEVDIETGEVVFEWYSFDHVNPKDSAFSLNGGDFPGAGTSETSVWDYFHANSIDKDDEGHYLLSARNTAAVYKINSTSGAIIWQLGGFHGTSDFAFDQDIDKFAFQHNARFHGRSPDGRKEYISLFDNAANSPTFKTQPASRALLLELDHSTRRARALRILDAPDGLSALSQGNAQLLPSGNVFVNWGHAGAITEFAADGAVLFHAYLDSEPGGLGVESYRGFRANWTGVPAEDPAIVVVPSHASSGSVDVYVSWNGDTETEAWRFYAVAGTASKATLLGEVKRTGFETQGSFSSVGVLSQPNARIYAEAIGPKKNTLRRTGLATVSSPPWYDDAVVLDQAEL